MEIRTKGQQFYQGNHEKLQVRKCSKEAEILYFQVESSSLSLKESPLHPCPIFGYIQYTNLAWLPSWICAD